MFTPADPAPREPGETPRKSIGRLVRKLFPGSAVEEVRPLYEDPGSDGTRKIDGYGKPLRVEIRDERGGRRSLVFRTASANEFGHDRRSDRAALVLLARDTFDAIPDHVRPLDVGAILPRGELKSLGQGGEFYLLTTFAEGELYADQLRRISAAKVAAEGDLARCEALAKWLASLHAQRLDEPAAYLRAVRDLIGSGEGIYGMIDGYGSEVAGAPRMRLRAIERSCAEYRWRLRGREKRLSRTHGDFHPFNIVFEGGTRFTLLDASRGCKGDPADDVTALAVNFLFFGCENRGAWERGFGKLWRSFWKTYLEESGDREVLRVLAPWLAWRCLVICSPRFYPGLKAQTRDALLAMAERALAEERFEPAWAEELFA